MMQLNRRRFLAISAAAGLAGRPASAGATARWRGVALGARAQMHLAGLSEADAAPVIGSVVAEIARLEDIFSLYRPQSVISRLNRDGHFAAPPAELLQLCSLASALHQASDGAFDPTVQPLWTDLANAAATGSVPDPDRIARARALVDWTRVHVDSARISFERPGMAITLNGIAQGFITDRIAARLGRFGLTDVLVDIGEIMAMGRSPDGGPWRVGIAGSGAGCCRDRIRLSDRALATSAPFGTVLGDAGRTGHILDPETGLTARQARQVSVSARRADVADGLSTALCVMDAARGVAALTRFPDARIESRVNWMGSASESRNQLTAAKGKACDASEFVY